MEGPRRRPFTLEYKQQAVDLVASSGRSADTRARFDVDPAPVPGYHASTLVIARETFAAVGSCAEDLSSGEFIEWAARARERALVLPMIEEVVTLRRVHGANTVLTARENLGTSYLKLVRARLKGGNR